MLKITLPNMYVRHFSPNSRKMNPGHPLMVFPLEKFFWSKTTTNQNRKFCKINLSITTTHEEWKRWRVCYSIIRTNYQIACLKLVLNGADNKIEVRNRSTSKTRQTFAESSLYVLFVLVFFYIIAVNVVHYRIMPKIIHRKINRLPFFIHI